MVMEFRGQLALLIRPHIVVQIYVFHNLRSLHVKNFCVQKFRGKNFTLYKPFLHVLLLTMCIENILDV